jgi:hypothetical protein
VKKDEQEQDFWRRSLGLKDYAYISNSAECFAANVAVHHAVVISTSLLTERSLT